MADKKEKKKSQPSGRDKKKKIKAQAKEETKILAEKRKADRRVIDNIWGLILIALGVFLFVAIQFGAAGKLGLILGDFLKGLFGLISFLVPWLIALLGILLMAKKTRHFDLRTVFLFLFILCSVCAINSGRFISSGAMDFTFTKFYMDGIKLDSGGMLGMSLGLLLIKLSGRTGLYLFSVVIIIICLMLLLNTPVSRAFEKLGIKLQERRNVKIKLEAARREEIERLKAEGEEIKERKKAEREAKAMEVSNSKNAENNGSEMASKDFASPVIKTFSDEPSRGSERTKVPPTYDDYLNGTTTGTTEPKEKKKGVFSFFKSEKVGRDDNVASEDSSIYENKESAAYSADEPIKYGIEARRVQKSGYGIEGDVSPNLTAEVNNRDNLDSSGENETEHPKEFPSLTINEWRSSQNEGSKPMDFQGASEYNSQSLKAEKNANKSNSNDLKGVVLTSPDKLSKKDAASLTLDKGEFANPIIKKYEKPPISLLNLPPAKKTGNLQEILRKKAEKLEQTLKNFNVDARVVNVTQGPAVTRYEIHPNVGVKVNSIVRLSDDIALNLEAKSIRIEAPIPGKAAVGIEVENDNINMVSLREIIGSKEFSEAESKITFAVGRDISGNAIVANLKDMPHLLIAGSTGSGKSVCINSIITSILYKANPDEVKLVLVDPKVVELGNYNGIPHLLIPVVTEPPKAAAALNWAVAEMNDRYKKFADNHVRDLNSFNKKMRNDGLEDAVLPQIVIIIDELADLMMAAPSQVEESICRLAQMARAAGMHLIVATQRPSVDIITGVIKANIPSRIAFAVSSQFDSRTILDMSGAEKLVGKGDMLFNPLGMGKPLRVQGTFVSDKEVNSVIDYVKEQVSQVVYADDVIDSIEKGPSIESQEDDGDELLQDAIACVVNAGQASVSMLQRRFRIGYNRAARIVDMMEMRGIVGPQDGSRPRQVLITKEELESMGEDPVEL